MPRKPSFTRVEAERTGRSQRSIQQSIFVAEHLIPELQDIITEYQIPHRQTDLLRLARMSPNAQNGVYQHCCLVRDITLRQAMEFERVAPPKAVLVELPEALRALVDAFANRFDPPLNRKKAATHLIGRGLQYYKMLVALAGNEDAAPFLVPESGEWITPHTPESEIISLFKNFDWEDYWGEDPT